MAEVHTSLKSKSKMYGVHTKDKKPEGNTKPKPHLPPMEEKDHPSRANSANSSNIQMAISTISQKQINAAIKHSDRIRTIVREKEIEISQLKTENSMLKQVF
jgi:hypothetical protein